MILKNIFTYRHAGCEVTARTADFALATGVRERHAILCISDCDKPFAEQLQALSGAFLRLGRETENAVCVMCRLFLSDASAQQKTAAEAFAGVPLSIIQQPPLDGSKIAAWCIFQSDMKCCGEGMFGHGTYRHRYSLGCEAEAEGSYRQTETLLERYENELAAEGMNIADNCVRTWFFVRDVDANYKGVVVARRENFLRCGLTEKTHYIASTGIEGKPDRSGTAVRMDAYAVDGLREAQQRYLYAKDHLNPTYEYGVTFERGVKVLYGDRSHLFISGTASIDNHGAVLHVGDIRRQTLRMWENVEALLGEGGATKRDVVSIVVYLRDMADYRTVREMFERYWSDTPFVITLAPVCRPEWLIEMECIAITGEGNRLYPEF